MTIASCAIVQYIWREIPMFANCPHCNVELNEDKVTLLRKLPSTRNKGQGVITMYWCKECGNKLPSDAVESKD